MRYPALNFSLYLLAGIVLALHGALWVLAVLVVPGRRWGALVLAFGLMYGLVLVKIPTEDVVGEGMLKVSELRRSTARFGRGWIVSGRLKTSRALGPKAPRLEEVMILNRV